MKITHPGDDLENAVVTPSFQRIQKDVTRSCRWGAVSYKPQGVCDGHTWKKNVDCCKGELF